MREGNSYSRFGDIRNLYKENEWSKSAAKLYDITFHIAVILCLPILLKRLDRYESGVVFHNIIKIRDVVRITGIIVVISAILFRNIDASTATLIFSYLAPLLIISGISWFTITIGTLKAELFSAAIHLTKWLLAVFSSIVGISSVVLIYAAPIEIAIIPVLVSYVLVYAAIIYDSLDSLTTGTDREVREYSMSSLARLHKEGFTIVRSYSEMEDIIASRSEEGKN